MTPEEITRRLEKLVLPGLLKWIEAVGDYAAETNTNVYLVGGIVRDLLLSRRNVDLDFVVEGDAIAFATEMKDQYGIALQAHKPFGTATWTPVVDIHLDFATTRTERYLYPGDLPLVDPTPTSIWDDLQRRDFTINAMAIQIPDNRLQDRFGGEADITNKLIRVLHDRSFLDDPTRIFRAARFEKRYKFGIEQHTESLIAPALPILDRVSGERIRREIDLIFMEGEPEQALKRLDQLGVLKMIDPNLRADEWLTTVFKTLRHIHRVRPGPLSYWPLLAFRLHSLERLLERLPMPRQIANNIETVRRVVTFIRSAEGLRPSQIVHGIEPLDNLHARQAAYTLAKLENPNTPLRDYINHWQHIQPKTRAKHLIAAGLQPSPLFGKLHRQLRDDLLDGVITPGQEFIHAQRLIELWTTPPESEE